VIWVNCKGLDKVRQAKIAVCVRWKEQLVAVLTQSASSLVTGTCCILEHEYMLLLGRGGMKLEECQAYTYLENKSLFGRRNCRWNEVILLLVLFSDAISLCSNVPW